MEKNRDKIRQVSGENQLYLFPENDQVSYGKIPINKRLDSISHFSLQLASTVSVVELMV